MPLDKINGEIGVSPSVAVQRGAAPYADMVVMPTDALGTPGILNKSVLDQLGLNQNSLPRRPELTKGYAIRDENGYQTCFVVTVGLNATPGANLKANLHKALQDPAIANASSMWIPLMGTGTGGLNLRHSLDTTLNVLHNLGWLERESPLVTISTPPNLTARQVNSLQDAIAAFLTRVAVPVATVPDVTPASTPHSKPGPTDKLPDNLSPALIALFEVATGLQSSKNVRLSTTLSFFALMEGPTIATPESVVLGPPFPGSEALLGDRSIALMSSAIADLAAADRDEAWVAAFKSSRKGRISLGPLTRSPRLTENMQRVMARASIRATEHGRETVDTDDFIEALFTHEEGRFHEALERLHTTRHALIEAYRDMRIGTISETLHNDLAASADMLGYASYADAIARFLLHEMTSPPLSVSIQAPWGAGKSSLMNLIRAKLDPDIFKSAEDKAKAEEADRKKGRLVLSDVLAFLNREGGKISGASAGRGQPITEDEGAVAITAIPAALRAMGRQIGKLRGPTAPPEAPGKPESVEPVGSGQRLTIWFNAWKYETSEQIWAGLVDAIVSQVSDRLPLIEREAFLLRLHLSRIDDGVVRRKIYDRIANRWWAASREWALWLGGAMASFVGLGALGKALGGDASSDLWSLLALAAPLGASASAALLFAVLALKYADTAAKTKKEPATFSLTDFMTVPDYHTSVGQIHQIHADLRRVLAKTPSITAGVQHDPIVIFIDDLDRCSPSKIASVVEGVSMLLASDTFRCMFVIGMDPQMVAAALEKAHEDVRGELPPYEQAVPLGWRFMDKFVQLPFTIPPSRKDRLDNYLDSLGAKTEAAETVPDAAPTAMAPASVPVLNPDPAAPATPPPSASGAAPAGGNNHPPATPANEAEPTIEASTDETRDVGRIIRRVASYTAGNPREAKRMVNLARLYLLLRNSRNVAEPYWKPPGLDQYARWIALTLRWPDMMRWLQWGSDEITWSPDDVDQALIVRRLYRLEHIAGTVKTFDDWKSAVADQLGLVDAKSVGWLNDRKLFEFFQSEALLAPTNRLSAAAKAEFW